MSSIVGVGGHACLRRCDNNTGTWICSSSSRLSFRAPLAFLVLLIGVSIGIRTDRRVGLCPGVFDFCRSGCNGGGGSSYGGR